MPKQHRQFLDKAEAQCSIREVVHESADADLVQAYNACLRKLSDWRSKHIGVVTTHIVIPGRKAQPPGQERALDEVDDGLSVQKESELQGTGGSALIPFLKQAREETLVARLARDVPMR